MADIDGYLKQIRSAEAGETVRDAIINCLRDINRDVPVQEENWEGYMPESTDLTLSGHYKSVHVMHNPSSGKSTKLTTLHATENDTYEPEENEYYNKVVVEVEQSPYTIREEAVEITENGTYYAKGDWGVNGVAEIHVNVTAVTGDGPFQVEFYDKVQTDPTAKVVYTELVPKGGNAEFKGTKPTSPIGPLTGWNPSPLNVTRDMKCYPQFGQVIVDPTEIMDDWEVICTNKGQGYPLGSHKLLAYGATFTADEIKTFRPDYGGGDVAFNILMMMYKVGEGEGNSHSSWISSKIDLTSYVPWLEYFSSINWSSNSIMRQFFNGIFFSHMSEIFKNNITPVTKYSMNQQGLLVPTQDAIWIPGTSEIGTDNTTPEDAEQYDFHYGDYLANIEKLDAVSTKYVRDFLNNDRNYVLAFSADYAGAANNNNILIRDTSNYGDSYSYRNQGIIWYGRGLYHNVLNIGFCL